MSCSVKSQVCLLFVDCGCLVYSAADGRAFHPDSLIQILSVYIEPHIVLLSYVYMYIQDVLIVAMA